MGHKILYIGRKQILELLYPAVTGFSNHPPRKHVLVPVVEGLPADAKIVEVHDDFVGRRLAFVVESAEYPEVPDGNIMDPIPARIRYASAQIDMD